jgi:putative Ca2+/H+ antiporter (TMEM165/GDT1 family)/glycosyltransferase involved in cell wall biosynthesis
MRILHTIPGRNWGGLEARTLEQVRWLAEHGHEAWVATPPSGEAMRRARALGISAVPFAFDRPWQPATLIAARRLVQSLRADVMDVHASRDAKVAIGCRDLCAVVRSRHIARAMRTSATRRAQWRIGADWVIATADCIRDQLIESRLVDPARVTTVGEWADERFFLASREAVGTRVRLAAQFGVAAMTPLVICVGMLRPDKGQNVLIRALCELRHRGVHAHCLLVGAPTTESAHWALALRDLARETQVAERVSFVGYRDDLPAVMAASDVVVLPSLSEARSRVAVQALAAGRPVIASRVGGLPEVVEDGVSGWLVPPADPAALAEAIESALARPAVAQARGAEGQRRVAATMRVEHQMERTLEAYRSAIAHARERRRVPAAVRAMPAPAAPEAGHSSAARPASARGGRIVARASAILRIFNIAAMALVAGLAAHVAFRPQSTLAVLAISAGSASLSEIGDKTQLLSLALTARFQRITPVLVGICVAAFANHAIAALAGAEVFKLLGGGNWAYRLLIVMLVALGIGALLAKPKRPATIGGSSSAFATTLVLMFLAEFGDKSQIATILLSTHYHALTPVVFGTTLGVLATDGLSVVVASMLAGRLPERALRWASAAVFLALGLASV